MNEEFGNSYHMPDNGGDGKGLAIASMVLGIIAVIFGCRWYLGLTAGIIGIVLGIMHNRRNGSCGMSIAGVVCGAIGVIIAILMLVLKFLGYVVLGGLLGGLLY